MSILLGMTAAFGWGAASVFQRQTTRVLGAVTALLLSQAMSFVVITGYVLLSGELVTRISGSQWQWWAWSILAATIHVFSLLMLYRSFEVGVLSVVAPIAGSYSAVTVVLSILSGETLSVLAVLGILIAIAGIVVVSVRPQPKQGAPRQWINGIGWAIGAAIGMGVGHWIVGFQVTPHLGGITHVFVVRTSSLVLLPLFVLGTSRSAFFHVRPDWRILALLLAGSLCANAAYVANNIGYTFGNVSIVSVIASMNSAATILLAWVFLKERLLRYQWLGVALVLTGIVLIGLP